MSNSKSAKNNSNLTYSINPISESGLGTVQDPLIENALDFNSASKKLLLKIENINTDRNHENSKHFSNSKRYNSENQDRYQDDSYVNMV